MTEETGFPIGPKKRGRPKKQLPPVTDGNAGEMVKKPRPACEKSELAKYPNPEEFVAWGIEPVNPRFKRKGIAVLYNPDHKGGQITLMPVTMGDDGMRWRYRGVPGPAPYQYALIPLEPGEAFSLRDKLGACLNKYFGGDVKVADKTTEDYHAKVRGDNLGELIRSKNVF